MASPRIRVWRSLCSRRRLSLRWGCVASALCVWSRRLLVCLWCRWCSLLWRLCPRWFLGAALAVLVLSRLLFRGLLWLGRARLRSVCRSGRFLGGVWASPRVVRSLCGRWAPCLWRGLLCRLCPPGPASRWGGGGRRPCRGRPSTDRSARWCSSRAWLPGRRGLRPSAVSRLLAGASSRIPWRMWSGCCCRGAGGGLLQHLRRSPLYTSIGCLMSVDISPWD